MEFEEITKIMYHLVDIKHLDKHVVDTLMENRDEIYAHLVSEKAKAVSNYNDFLDVY